VADRDLGAGDLGGGDAAHLAHALLQGVPYMPECM
jgi:hypothetical protein